MELSSDLVYLIGFIYGDGYIKSGPKSKTDNSTDYKIGIEISDIEFLKEVILPLFVKFTNTKSRVRTRQRKTRKKMGIIEIRNKKFFKLLTEEIGTHKGAKLDTLEVPFKIKQLPLILRKEFIAGYFDADGGIRNRSIGFTSSSRHMIDFVEKQMKLLDIGFSRDSWVNKNTTKTYFGLRIKRDNIDIFLNTINLRNTQKLAQLKASTLN